MQAVQRKAKRWAIGIGIAILLAVAAYFPLHYLWERNRPFPVSCNGDLDDPEVILIEDRDLDEDGVLVNAKWHCKVVIRNSNVTAGTIVKSDSNATVEVENSTLHGRKALFDLNNFDNHLTITGGELSADGTGTAVHVDRGAVTLRGTNVRSNNTVIDVDRDRLDISNSEVVGKSTGVRGTLFSDITIDGGRVEGAVHAIDMEGSKLDVHNCKVVGPVTKP